MVEGSDEELRRIKGLRGFWDRLEDACIKSGMTKVEITRRMNVDRKVLYRGDDRDMNCLYVARFCAVTGTDANWLLGLKGANE